MTYRTCEACRGEASTYADLDLAFLASRIRREWATYQRVSADYAERHGPEEVRAFKLGFLEASLAYLNDEASKLMGVTTDAS